MGFYRKLLQLEIIDSLLDNSNSNSETHLHMIADISANFMMNKNLSQNWWREEDCRTKAALILSKLCNSYRLKYPNLSFIIYAMCKNVMDNLIDDDIKNSQ